MKTNYFKYLLSASIFISIIGLILISVFLISHITNVGNSASHASSQWIQPLNHKNANSPFTAIRGNQVVSCNGVIYIPHFSQIDTSTSSEIEVAKFSQPDVSLAKLAITAETINYFTSACFNNNLYIYWTHRNTPSIQFLISGAVYDTSSNTISNQGDITSLITQTGKPQASEPTVISTGNQMRMVFESGDEGSLMFNARVATSTDGNTWNVDPQVFGADSNQYTKGNPDMSSDGNHIAFADNNGIYVSDLNEGKWSNPIIINAKADIVYPYLSIDIDGNGYEYVSWQEASGSIRDIAIGYKKISDSSFKVISNISQNTSSSASLIIPKTVYIPSTKQLSIFWSQPGSIQQAYTTPGTLPNASSDFITTAVPYAQGQSSISPQNAKSITIYIDSSKSLLYLSNTARDNVVNYSTWTALADISSPFGGGSILPTQISTPLPTPTTAPVLGQCTGITVDNANPDRTSTIHLTTVISQNNPTVAPYDWYYSFDENTWFNYSGGGQPAHNSIVATTSFSDLKNVPANINSVYYTIGNSTTAGVGAGGTSQSLKYTCEIKVNIKSSTPTPTTAVTTAPSPTNAITPSPVVSPVGVTPTTNVSGMPTSTSIVTPTAYVTYVPTSAITPTTSQASSSPSINNGGGSTTSNCTNISQININTNNCSTTIQTTNPFKLNGTATSQSLVTINISGTNYPITSQSDGSWSWSSTVASLTVGTYQVSVSYTDVANNPVTKNISIVITNLPNTGITDMPFYITLITVGLIFTVIGSGIIIYRKNIAKRNL